MLPACHGQLVGKNRGAGGVYEQARFIRDGRTAVVLMAIMGRSRLDQEDRPGTAHEAATLDRQLQTVYRHRVCRNAFTLPSVDMRTLDNRKYGDDLARPTSCGADDIDNFSPFVSEAIPFALVLTFRRLS